MHLFWRKAGGQRESEGDLKNLNSFNASEGSAWSEQAQRRKQTRKKLAVYFPSELQVKGVNQGLQENKFSSHMYIFCRASSHCLLRIVTTSGLSSWSHIYCEQWRMVSGRSAYWHLLPMLVNLRQCTLQILKQATWPHIM